MTEQELRGLDIKVAKLLGWRVTEERDDGRFCLLNPSGISVNCYYDKSMCWRGIPKFTSSLDACAPLKKEMTVIGEFETAEFRVHIENGYGDKTYRAALERTAMNEEGGQDIVFTESIVAESEEIAICLLYRKFKELTTEENA